MQTVKITIYFTQQEENSTSLTLDLLQVNLLASRQSLFSEQRSHERSILIFY